MRRQTGRTARSTRRVAVIGLADVGRAVAYRLATGRFAVTVFDRDSVTTETVAPAVARPATSPQQAVRGADVLLMCLDDELLLDEMPFDDLVAALLPGMVVIDLTPTSPGYARDVTRRLAARGVRRIEACLIGDPALAATGDVGICAAGQPADVAAARDVLSRLSRQGFRHVGEAGDAALLGIAHAMVLAAQTAAFGEAVGLAEAAGLHREALYAAVAAVDGHWPGPRLPSRTPPEGGYRLFATDAYVLARRLQLAVELADEHGRRLPLAQQVSSQLDRAVDSAGDGEDLMTVLTAMQRTEMQRVTRGLTLAGGGCGDGCACGGS